MVMYSLAVYRCLETGDEFIIPLESAPPADCLLHPGQGHAITLVEVVEVSE